MESFTYKERNELNLASRKAEEAALRRYQAVYWLDYLVGPLGIPSQPSEKEFISCLRNGILLCNLINKIQPGSVPKVVQINSTSDSLSWDSQPLPAYQYFENIRNFLAAVEDLKLPAFEASVFERENLKEGSSRKVADCILELKAYHEWKQMTGGYGAYKPTRSPLVLNSVGVNRAEDSGTVTHNSSRQLDMTEVNGKSMLSVNEINRLEDKIVNALAERMLETKENMDNSLFASYRSGNVDSMNFFTKIISSCLEEQFQKTFPDMKSSTLDHVRERSSLPENTTHMPFQVLQNLEGNKCCRACLEKGKCNHWNLVAKQEKELTNIKQLLSSAKKEFESMECQFQSDLKQLGDQVVEMSTVALGYHKVVKENRNLYNMVQDLRGNIRVFCRIRPACDSTIQSTINYIGKDGSLVVMDPLKPQKDGQKHFQFNRVFGPTATQDDVFSATQPLIRSVMDGYNVCIFAYGQTGSGKTHTMNGPSEGSASELGISYLALTDLFNISHQRKGIMKYEIQVQVVEIYNEQVRDLLAENSATTRLEIRSCTSENNLALPNATLRPVKSTGDVINLMKLGELSRAVGSTAMNAQSSRSHSILTVHVRGDDVSGNILHGCLHLVDLAGSERVDKSEVSGEGLKEAQYINKSLACLGDVITALAQKNSHIPYRNSKLTLLLQNSLGGNAKVLMFAHASPEADSFGETISTLKFAQRVSTVELGAARSNKETAEVLELQAQISCLKKALAGKEARTPVEKTAEKTPTTRARRLSIENDDKRGIRTPVVKPRSRRLSLEGPRNARQIPMKSPTNTAIRSSVMSIDTAIKYPPLQVTKSPEPQIKKKKEVPRNAHQTPFKSSTSTAIRSSVMSIDTAIKYPSLQLPKTPEPQMKKKKEVPVVAPNERKLCEEMQTPCSTQGRGSQIRKSLRTIGKFIHGSEKRNQTKQTSVHAMYSGTSIMNEPKSPSNAMALRRQSLTGIPSESSTRSSLGGASAESCVPVNQSAKTPPPQVRASGKLMKRWL